jgi:hypothetical protein
MDEKSNKKRQEFVNWYGEMWELYFKAHGFKIDTEGVDFDEPTCFKELKRIIKEKNLTFNKIG